MNQDLTTKQQATEAIRQAESILITAGQRPTVDQAAAVLALGMVLKKLGKRVSTVISDSLPPRVNFLPLAEIEKDLGGLRDFVIRLDLSKAEVDKLRYTIENGKLNLFITPFSGSFDRNGVSFDYGQYNYDLAIVLGVASRDRIDKAITGKPEFVQKVPIINIDFHRSNENYGAVNLMDTQAASLCEILAGIAESLQVELDENIATAMLAGLYASTDRFTATHTSAKSLTLSAQLISAGARQQQIVKSLFAGEPEKRFTPEKPEKKEEPVKDLKQLTNPPAPKSEQPKPEKKPAAKAPAVTPTEELPEVKEKPRVKAEPQSEDLAPEERVKFELPQHIKSGLSQPEL